MQNHWNLLYREEEREMVPLCLDQGVGFIPWSPLARGRLGRPPGAKPTKRSESDGFGKRLYGAVASADEKVLAALDALATRRKLPHAQVALAWLMARDGVAAPIVGATKLEHLETAAGAVGVTLAAEEMAPLEAAYVAHPVAGF
jgi:aryl-alcohol dehydrogenase-like predicted oxidoreductase